MSRRDMYNKVCNFLSFYLSTLAESALSKSTLVCAPNLFTLVHKGASIFHVHARSLSCERLQNREGKKKFYGSYNTVLCNSAII
uniref:Uncharacterized protein n=1 Tax=Anguilla anguilla TaxID=7936 RepID=A0A0E9WN79_ANGAN